MAKGPGEPTRCPAGGVSDAFPCSGALCLLKGIAAAMSLAAAAFSMAIFFMRAATGFREGVMRRVREATVFLVFSIMGVL